MAIVLRVVVNSAYSTLEFLLMTKDKDVSGTSGMEEQMRISLYLDAFAQLAFERCICMFQFCIFCPQFGNVCILVQSSESWTGWRDVVGDASQTAPLPP